MCIKTKILIILSSSFIFCMQRTELGPNDSYFETFISNNDGEFLLELNALSNTNWSETNNESSILTIYIDGEYNQDIVLYNGNQSHLYKQGPTGGLGCFTPDNFPIFDTFRENVHIIADSNHGYKMIGVGELVANDVLEE